jgi:hypothetical protein
MHLRLCFLYPRKFVKNTNLKFKIKEGEILEVFSHLK